MTGAQRNSRKRGSFCGVLLLLCCLGLTGCGSASPKEVQVFDYQLAAAEDAYSGLMGVPLQSNCPVVFILHGAHAMDLDSPTPYYQGFEYLVKALAERGYLAISLDINRAYTGDSPEGDEYTRVKRVFEASYDTLVRASEGEKVFPADLKGKSDLSKINMIGHSRGGDNITRLIKDPLLRKVAFVSALKIAASETNSLRELYVDVPTALIYSQYDEDIAMSDSADYYYYAYNRDLARNTFLISAFLYGANHAAYNSLVNQPGLSERGEAVTRLDAEEQRLFTTKFAIDFLNVNNHGASLLDVFHNQTTKQYGIEFMLSIYEPSDMRIFRADKDMQALTAQGVRIKSVVSSSNDLKNTAEAFHPPGAAEDLSLCKLTWDKAGGRVQIPFYSMGYQISEKDYLALYLALDSSDGRNGQAKPTTFDLVLTDNLGNQASIPFSSAVNTALKYQAGKLIAEENAQGRWSELTPLGTELIPLASLAEQLAIDNIELLEIVPTSERGSILIDGMDVYPSDAN